MMTNRITMTKRITFLMLIAAALAGCDKAEGGTERRGDSKVSPATGQAPGASASAAVAEAPATAAEPAAPPCIAGTWDAKEFVARARGAFRGAVGSSGLATASGTITFEFAPPVDGKGEVTARALGLSFKVSLGESGLKAKGTVTVTGTSVAPYTLGPGGELTIGRPTEGKLTARGVVKTSGLVSMKKTTSSTVETNGEFVIECEGDKLRLHDRTSSGKAGRASFALARVVD